MIAKGDSLKLKYNIGSKTKQQEEDYINEKSPLLGDTEQTYAKSKTLDLERANQKPGEKGGNTGLPVPEYTYQNAGEKEESVESQKSQQSVYSDHVGFERSGQVLPCEYLLGMIGFRNEKSIDTFTPCFLHVN